MRTLKKLVKTFCLVAAGSVLASCAPDYPEVHPKLVDWRRQRYLVHELIDRKNVTFRKVEWVYSMKDLDQHYCLSSAEIAALNGWAREKQAQRASDRPTE